MQAVARGPRRGVRGPARQALRPLRVPGRLPDQGRRDGAVMTARSRSTPPSSCATCCGADFTFSEQQFAAITAPLEPAVVIAGAGSGKTTVMAARVVWLVATGRVAPGEVLGLTFTTKATAELATGSATALRAAGLLPSREAAAARRRRGDELEEPTVSTYHSYASALLSEHGLRIGHEPDTRLIADAVPLPARGPGGAALHPHRSQQLTDSPQPRRPATCSRSTAR